MEMIFYWNRTNLQYSNIILLIYSYYLTLVNPKMMSGGDQKTVLCITVGLILCFGLPFIIADLVFAYNDTSECLNQDLNAVSFTLKTWLLVHAYVNLATLLLIILFVIMYFINPDAAAAFGVCVMCFMCLGALFGLAWFIVGAIIFWGQLHPEGTCNSSLNTYMWILLILTAIGSVCNLGNAGQNRQR